MNIDPLLKSFLHPRIATNVSNNPQFDLRIIQTQQRSIRAFRNKRLPNFPAQLRTNRNVLQIGVLTTQSARCGNRLVKMRMNPTRIGINQQRQCINISAFQFLQCPKIHNVLHDRVLAQQRIQGFLICLILACFGFLGFVRQLQLLKQYFSHLLRRCDVKHAPRI